MPVTPDELALMAQRVTPDLMRYFLRRVDPPADAADLLSDVLVVLCRRPNDIPDDPHEQRLWAYGVARNVLNQHRRTSRRRSALTDRLRDQLAHEEATSVVSTPALDALSEALMLLAPDDRELLRLVHWEGLSQADAARVLGQSPGAVRSRYLRALTRLKAHIERELLAVVER